MEDRINFFELKNIHIYYILKYVYYIYIYVYHYFTHFLYINIYLIIAEYNILRTSTCLR